MYLKSIKLVGFKSFVDATVIPVRGYLNAIVGPNGCGKSNIVDAIRWVIGEISAKQLRGQSMNDVIFNGTVNRKAVGKAMVELLFDNQNPSGKKMGQYAQYAEIAVRREIERDGQSHYYLNGTVCRRRDILDIFLGTGLGSRSYSIIEQGMIAELIEAKPEELRAHIEEVAGISKYKERRRETEIRIQHTQDNLERLNDLRAELAKQLQHLKRQAQAAERYQLYKEEERNLNSQIKALQWKDLEAQLLSQHALMNTQATLCDQEVAKLRHLEANLEKLRLDQIAATDHHGNIQKKYYEQATLLARLEQDIKYQQAQRQRNQEELKQLTVTWEELTTLTTEYEQQIEEIEQDLAELIPQKEIITEEVVAAKDALNAAEMDMQEWYSNWEDFQKNFHHVSNQSEIIHTKLNHTQQQFTRQQDQQQKIQAQLAQINHRALADEIEPLTEEVKSLTDILQGLSQELKEASEFIAHQRTKNNKEDALVAEQRKQLQTMLGRRASLNELQQAALKKDNEKVKLWLSQKNILEKTRLGQQLKVKSGWEKAVEIVLSTYFDSVCIETMDALLDSIDELKSGSLTLLEIAKEALPSAHHAIPTLRDQVHSDWPIEQWLKDIYIAEDLVQAKKLASELKAHESIITAQGIWLGKNWVRINKENNPQQGVLLREQQLQALALAIEEQQKELDLLTASLNEGKQVLTEWEKKRDELQSAYQKASHTLTKVQSQLSTKQAYLKEYQNREIRLTQEMNALENQTTLLVNEIEILKKEYEQVLQHKLALEKKRESFLIQRNQYQNDLKQKRLASQQIEQHAEELTVRIASSQTELNLLQQTLKREINQCQQISARKAKFEEDIFAYDAPLENMKHQLQSHLEARSEIQAELQQAENHIQTCNHSLQQLTEQHQSILSLVQATQQHLQALQVERQTLLVRQEAIKERLLENKLDLSTILTELSPVAEIKAWEESLIKITTKISRLGPINLAAIHECHEVDERKKYLDQQQNDLVEALDILQTAIRKIDKETKTRFQETFDKVNAGFQQLFPRIFNGGMATLELTDDDLLATGIVVKAQPPGKRNSTIYMLSGGEKALTAVALIFAIFRLNPAPFCILDEVDAPLDDLNVGRFCQLVKEMSQETQFLMISHNKITISIADYLMGITMNEPGVSRIVAVDIKDAMAIAETVQ